MGFPSTLQMTGGVSAPRDPEAGFTLIEALAAIGILAVGLASIASLFVAASASNLAANQSTAAAVAASEQLELLKSTPFDDVARGGSLDGDVDGFSRDVLVEGVGWIRTRWRVTPVAGRAQLLHVEVRSEAIGALGAARTRAQLASLRACTDPLPDSAGGACAEPPCCPFPP
jgi:type II secretory pathway pseudopilin PulG